MKRSKRPLKTWGNICVVDEECKPVLGTENSAAIDVKADIKAFAGDSHSYVDIDVGETKLIPTGVYFFLPKRAQKSLRVCCKSGLAIKKGVWTCQRNGSSELQLVVVNGNSGTVRITHGQPIAQVMIYKDNKQLRASHALHCSKKVVLEARTQHMVPVCFEYRLRKHEGGIISSYGKCPSFKIFPGIIDSDYEGQLYVFCMNEGETPITIDEGDIIGILQQFKVINYTKKLKVLLIPSRLDAVHNDQRVPSHVFSTPNKLEKLEVIKTMRGNGGFGSTSRVTLAIPLSMVYRNRLSFSYISELLSQQN